MTDLDRRCAKQVRELQGYIDRMDGKLARLAPRAQKRREQLLIARNSAIVELHDMQRAHAAYDARLAEAMHDPTGQDLDSFQWSE